MSANRSGNDENYLDRRAPLALAAAENIMRRYPVDASRVYVGGLSGGARVALAWRSVTRIFSGAHS